MLYPEATASKSTRPAGSGDLELHATGHTFSGFAVKQTVEACPDEMWASDAYHNRFWHIAYHALFYAHLYLQPSEAEFRPWAKYKPDSQCLRPRP
jgi:hypothetical protein